jgi:hypothetical protein
MNYRCYQITLDVKYFYTNQERRELLAGYLSLQRRPGWAIPDNSFTFFYTEQ